MALLIVLAIIGGLVGLIALYVLGTYLIAAILGHTILFKEKIQAVLDGYRAKRQAKKQAKVEKEESKPEEPKQEEVEEPVDVQIEEIEQ